MQFAVRTKSEILNIQNMIQSNKIIQGLWVNGSLNNLQCLCIKSFLSNGHDFHLYTYNSEIEAPLGTTIIYAGEIIPEKDIFLDERGGLSTFADMFRYELLYIKGGWWVDMDIVCLRSFDFKSDYIFGSEYVNFAGNSKPIINIGVMKVPPKSDIMQYCKDTANKVWKTDYPNIQWAAFGRKVLDLYMEMNEEYKKYIQHPHVFCPLPFFLNNLFYNDILIDFTEKTYSIHFWNELTRQKNVNMNDVFHSNSIFERYKNLYKVTSMRSVF